MLTDDQPRASRKSPEVAVEKTPLALRICGAVALAAITPLAALLPLIETGPGKDTDCRRVLAAANDAQGQARGPAAAPVVRR